VSERDKGRWEIVGRSGVVGAHAALMHTNQILFFTRPEEPANHRISAEPNPSGFLNDGDDAATKRPDLALSAIFPLVGDEQYRPQPRRVVHNPFCAGHAQLPDGRLVIVGGDKRANSGRDPEGDFQPAPLDTRFGLQSLRVFTPEGASAGEWETIGEISDARWYPTCTILADGRIFVLSGSIDDQDIVPNLNPTCELLPPMAGGPQFMPFLIEAWPYHSYPFVYVLPSGELYVFARCTGHYLRLGRDAHGMERFEIRTGAALSTGVRPPAHEPSKHYPNNAAAVLLPLRPEKNHKAEVMIFGGSGTNLYSHWIDHSHHNPASSDVWRMAVEPADKDWRPAAAMPHPRVMPDAVLLPDGKVLVVNGAARGYAGGSAATGPAVEWDAVMHADLYDPVANSWKTLAVAGCERLYHSSALLLPDATVLVAGNDHRESIDRYAPDDAPPANPAKTKRRTRLSELAKLSSEKAARYWANTFEFRVEIFTPPYLCSGKVRPEIRSAPSSARYGSDFTIELGNLADLDGAKICCVLLHPGSTTHCNNMSQRHVGLEMVSQDAAAGTLTLRAPPGGGVAPPGWYMLFVLHDGVPSIAKFVRLLLDPGGARPDPRVADAGLALCCGRIAACWRIVAAPSTPGPTCPPRATMCRSSRRGWTAAWGALPGCSTAA
jgi:hypothetical protein